jgi:hypothetical protein
MLKRVIMGCHYTGIDIQIMRPEMTKFKMFREKVNMDFYFVGITF